MAMVASAGVDFAKKHRKFALQRFTKVLHAFGVDVKEHSGKLGIEETELKDFEAEIGRDNIFKPGEKRELISALEDLIALLVQIESLERVIKEELNSHLIAAKNYASSLTDLKILGALKEIHSGLHNRMATKLKIAIPNVRAFIMNSFDVESKKIFSPYRNILRRAEKIIAQLSNFEHRISDESSRPKREFLRLSSKLRRIIHVALFELSRDIGRAYDLRADLYRWLIDADKQLHPRLNENLEMEYEQLMVIKSLYLKLYKEHISSVFQTYVQKPGAVKK